VLVNHSSSSSSLNFLNFEMDAPGVKNDAVDEEPDPIKRRCIRVYEKAHEAVTVELKALYSKLDTKATKLEADDHAKDQGQAVRQEAEEIKAMIELGKEQFREWYEEDMVQYEKFDSDHDGSLNKTEFKNWLQEKYDMEDASATAIFEAWDIDGGKSIGKFEFCSLLATCRLQEKKITRQVVAEDLEATVDGMFCCGQSYFLFSMAAGTYCCCCTCGLSCCPLLCQMSYMADKVKYNLEHAEEMMKNQERKIQEKFKAEIPKKLQQGPKEGLKGYVIKKQNKTAQSITTEKTPLLGA